MRQLIYIILVMIVAATPAFPGTISFIIGSVKIKSQANWMNAEPGMKIVNGDTIKTMKKSLAIVELINGSVVKLYPNTTFTFNAGAQQGGGAILDLAEGSVFAKIRKMPGGTNFSIKHQTVVASVRGTLFYFALQKKLLQSDDLWICVKEGAIDVKETVKSESVTVKEGEGILIKGARTITPPKVYEWTKKLDWNMDPSKGPVIGHPVLKGEEFSPVY